MSITKLTMNEKVSLLKELYQDIASKGQEGDTMLAHINPYEAELLKAHGGSGTINPSTGLPEFKGAVKAAVKIAPYALAAYGGYSFAAAGGFGAAAGAATWTGTAATTAGSIGAVGVTASGIGIGTALQAAGLGLKVYGGIQERKYQKQQSAFSRQAIAQKNAADAQRNRYNQLQSKRQRIAAARQMRIQQAGISGSMGNVLGQGGTSGYVGAIGSLSSQAAANIGNINTAQGYGNDISRLNTMSANYTSQANDAGSKASMWSDTNLLGGSLFKDSERYANFANKIFT